MFVICYIHLSAESVLRIIIGVLSWILLDSVITTYVKVTLLVDDVSLC